MTIRTCLRASGSCSNQSVTRSRLHPTAAAVSSASCHGIRKSPLVDIGLPDMDGYQVATQLRALNLSARPFLVALTGYGQPEDRRRALSSGFDLHLTKPVDVDELTRVLSWDGPA